MKNSKWILIVAAVALFSAQHTHRTGAETPDYSRNPAAVRPVSKHATKASHKRKTQDSARRSES